MKKEEKKNSFFKISKATKTIAFTIFKAIRSIPNFLRHFLSNSNYAQASSLLFISPLEPQQIVVKITNTFLVKPKAKVSSPVITQGIKSFTVEPIETINFVLLQKQILDNQSKNLPKILPFIKKEKPLFIQYPVSSLKMSPSNIIFDFFIFAIKLWKSFSFLLMDLVEKLLKEVKEPIRKPLKQFILFLVESFSSFLSFLRKFIKELKRRFLGWLKWLQLWLMRNPSILFFMNFAWLILVSVLLAKLFEKNRLIDKLIDSLSVDNLRGENYEEKHTLIDFFKKQVSFLEKIQNSVFTVKDIFQKRLQNLPFYRLVIKTFKKTILLQRRLIKVLKRSKQQILLQLEKIIQFTKYEQEMLLNFLTYLEPLVQKSNLSQDVKNLVSEMLDKYRALGTSGPKIVSQSQSKKKQEKQPIIIEPI